MCSWMNCQSPLHHHCSHCLPHMHPLEVTIWAMYTCNDTGCYDWWSITGEYVNNSYVTWALSVHGGITFYTMIIRVQYIYIVYILLIEDNVLSYLIIMYFVNPFFRPLHAAKLSKILCLQTYHKLFSWTFLYLCTYVQCAYVLFLSNGCPIMRLFK